MIRTLIHFPEDRIAAKGGPAGYLYNLRVGLKEISAEGFDFLPSAGNSYESNRMLQRLVPERIKDIRRLCKLLSLPNRHLSAPIDYSRYGCIHFHSTEDLFLHREALEQYNGKVILTSHSPCVYHRELISRLNPKDATWKANELTSLERIDEYAFQRADIIVFPCPEAEEPYFHTWTRYSTIRDRSKLRYLPTGIQACKANIPKETIRLQLGIPADAFVMCYAGRHNSVKGYDLLTEAVLPLLDRDENIWMVVAGKEGPLFSPVHEHWVEIGWTDDPHSIIAASDVFILPNRETFFDLIMLEVLSLGIPIVATNTGGNKYFGQFHLPGIQLFSGLDGFKDALAAIERMSVAEWQSAVVANKELFQAEFNCLKFAKRYEALIRGICD